MYAGGKHWDVRPDDVYDAYSRYPDTLVEARARVADVVVVVWTNVYRRRVRENPDGRSDGQTNGRR